MRNKYSVAQLPDSRRGFFKNDKQEKQATPTPPPQRTIPHYTAASVLQLFRDNDPRIQQNPYGTEKSIQLSEVPGYFTYSDKKGGIATFYDGQTKKPVFTAAREINDELRAAKCGNPNCQDPDACSWDKLIYKCGCEEHHDGDRFDVIPRVELCDSTRCDGEHVHLLGFCDICFDIEDSDGKEPKDILADNIHFLMR